MRFEHKSFQNMKFASSGSSQVGRVLATGRELRNVHRRTHHVVKGLAARRSRHLWASAAMPRLEAGIGTLVPQSRRLRFAANVAGRHLVYRFPSGDLISDMLSADARAI